MNRTWRRRVLWVVYVTPTIAGVLAIIALFRNMVLHAQASGAAMEWTTGRACVALVAFAFVAFGNVWAGGALAARSENESGETKCG